MLAINNVTIVTMDKERRILTDAVVVLDGENIIAVGKTGDVLPAYPDAEIVDGNGKVALPGLIDTHAHADQAILRGLGDCLHWIPFLDDVIDPYLMKRDPRESVLANQLAMIEMLKSGTTCFVSPNVDPGDDYAAMSAAIGELGIRAVLGRFTMPKPGEDSPAIAKRALEDATCVMRRWHESEGGLVHLWFGLDVPRRPGDTDHPNFYREVAEESKRLNVGIVYHFCSEIEDADYIVDTYGVRPAEWSRDNHALGENVLLINGCWVTAEEIAILADTGTHLAHSPVANMKMATGILPLSDVLNSGINVSLGTDGALNNNSYDMFAEMKTACLLQNATQRSASALTAETALELATINGAQSIGRANDLGSIEIGKKADIVLLDMGRSSALPMHNLVSNLVFSCSAANVDMVFVNGRLVVEKGCVTGVNENRILDGLQEKAVILRDKLELNAGGKWPVV